MRKITFLWKSDKPLFHDLPPWSRAALLVCALVYFGACAALALNQRSALYHPMLAMDPAPSAAEGSTLDRRGSAGGLHWLARSGPEARSGLCAPGPSGSRPAVAYFGGNAERPSAAAAAAAAKFPGCRVYALAYPGFEGAPGSPTEESIHRAADAMVESMRADGVDMAGSLLMGRSLGSGVAARQASLGACALAGLVTPYDSLELVAADAYPWAPVALLMLDRFDARPWARAARCPAAIVYADEDAVIAPGHALALRGFWSRPVLWMGSVLNSDHATILDKHASWASIMDAWTQARGAAR